MAGIHYVVYHLILDILLFPFFPSSPPLPPSPPTFNIKKKKKKVFINMRYPKFVPQLHN